MDKQLKLFWAPQFPPAYVNSSFTVVDEVCDDKSYETDEVSENKDAEKSEEEELLEATKKGNLVEAKAGEILIEVRPQYCEFSDKELALKLTKHVGFRLLCLPWVANTGRHFYTAGFKTTEESYEQFKSQGNGKISSSFTVSLH